MDHMDMECSSGRHRQRTPGNENRNESNHKCSRDPYAQVYIAAYFRIASISFYYMYLINNIAIFNICFVETILCKDYLYNTLCTATTTCSIAIVVLVVITEQGIARNQVIVVLFDKEHVVSDSREGVDLIVK